MSGVDTSGEKNHSCHSPAGRDNGKKFCVASRSVEFKTLAAESTIFLFFNTSLVQNLWPTGVEIVSVFPPKLDVTLPST